MLIVSTGRGDLLKHLPMAHAVAEIGVFRGGFAALILRNARPKILHLVDPWGKDPADEYIRSYRVTDDMEALYRAICDRYAKQITERTIVVHRDYSTRAAAQFRDGELDWVYIDGMHSFEAVSADLEAFAPKIHGSGFILGHDFSNTRMGRVKKFGVIGAVRRFCDRFGWHIVLITNEDAPTYVLTRNGNDEVERKFVGRVLSSETICAIEVDESLIMCFEQVDLTYANGKRKQLFRFGDVPPARRHPYL